MSHRFLSAVATALTMLVIACSPGIAIGSPLPASARPVEATGLAGVVDIDADETQTCAVRVDGTLWCWGGWVAGLAKYSVLESPTLLEGIEGATQVVVDSHIFCVAHTDGTVDCWRFDASRDATGRLYPPAPLTYGSGLSGGIVDLTHGVEGAICALKSNGTVWCWGRGEFGQLGDGQDRAPHEFALSPVQVRGITTATGISQGARHACAVLQSGAVRCWGAVLGGSGATNEPVDVVGLPPASSVMSSDDAACAVSAAASRLWCWGQNHLGKLGAGQGPGPTPWRVNGLPAVTSAVGGPFHTCARGVDASAWCLGGADHGRLGVDDSDGGVPNPVAAVSGVAQLALGKDHSCALLVGGSVKCWGSNAAGQLGNGPPPPPTTPTSPTTPTPTSPTPPLLPPAAPVIRAANVSPTTTVAGQSIAFTLTASTPGAVQIVITRAMPGRFVAGVCRAPSRRTPSKRKCKFSKPIATLRREHAGGDVLVTFSGQVAGQQLARGLYRATITTTGPTGLRSTPIVLRFRIRTR